MFSHSFLWHRYLRVSSNRSWKLWIFAIGLTCHLTGCGTDPATSAEQFLTQAREDTLENKPFAAIIQAKNALKANPELFDARWILAQNYLKLREGALAEDQIKRLKEGDFLPVGIETAHLDSLMQQGKYQEVINLGTTKDNTPLAKTIVGEAHLGVSDLYIGSNQRKYQDGHISLARSAFHQAMEADSTLARPHLGLARIAVWETNFDLANTYLDKAEALEKSNPSLWILRGIVQQSVDDLSGAADSYREAANLMPYDLLARMNLSRVLLAQRKLEEASQLLDTLIREHPNMPVLGYLRAIAFLMSGDREAAANVLSGVVKDFASYTEAQFLLGRVLFDLGQCGHAEVALGEVLNKFPAHEKARVLYEKSKIAAAHNTSRGTTESQSAIDESELQGSVALALTDGELARSQRQIENPTASLIGQMASMSHPQKIATVESTIGQGDLDTAHAATFEIARTRPNDPEPLEILGRIARTQNDLTIARTYYLQALKKDEEYVPAIVGIAELDFQTQEFDLARKGFEHALSLNENNVLSLLGLARIDLVIKNYAAAEEKLARITALKPASINVLVVSAELASATNNREREQKVLDEILSIDKHSFNGNFLKARYLENSGDVEKASLHIQRALKRFPQHIGALLLHAELMLQAGNTEAAQALTAELAHQFPQNTEVQRAYAATTYRGGNVELARRILAKALHTSPDDLGLLDAMMHIQYEQKNYQEAATLASSLVEIAPGYSKAYRVIGDAQLNSGQANQAYDNYRLALESSNTFDTAEKIYLFARAAGQTSLIRNLFKSWLEDHPDDTHIVLIMASDNQASGEHQNAIDAYERIIKKNPEDATALNDLAWIYHLEGRDEALSLAEKAYAINQRSPNILDTLGWILTERGNFKRAIPLLKEAAYLLPNVGDVHYHLAQAYLKADQLTPARDALERALQSENLTAREAAMRLMAEIATQ